MLKRSSRAACLAAIVLAAATMGVLVFFWRAWGPGRGAKPHVGAGLSVFTDDAHRRHVHHRRPLHLRRHVLCDHRAQRAGQKHQSDAVREVGVSLWLSRPASVLVGRLMRAVGEPRQASQAMGLRHHLAHAAAWRHLRAVHLYSVCANAAQGLDCTGQPALHSGTGVQGRTSRDG